MLTDRPVDETPLRLVGVEVGSTLGRGDVIDRDLPGWAQLCVLCEDIVFPLPDARDGVVLVLCRLPGPGSQRHPAGFHIPQRATAGAPGATEHAIDDQRV